MGGLLTRLSFRSAGESHGPAVVAVLEGLPRGLELDLAAIDAQLRRRQGGAGRGGRQRIEDDRAEVLSGLRKGRTIGSPLCLLVRNRDHSIDRLPEPTRPRPGHADLAGCYRYRDLDIRGTLERASARETAARVAAGAVAQQLLHVLGCSVFGFVRAVAGASLEETVPGEIDAGDLAGWREARDGSRVYTLTPEADRAMLAAVQKAGRDQDTVGGVVEVRAVGVLPGLGSCLQWEERLDARLAAALVSIPAFKGMEVGPAFANAAAFGSQVHDAIVKADSGRLIRPTNRAGGLEGGMTTGCNLVVRGAMKPISTLRKPLESVDLATGAPAAAGYERSDICAISAASVVAEAMVALVLLDALLARVGGETMDELETRHRDLRNAADRLGEGGQKTP